MKNKICRFDCAHFPVKKGNVSETCKELMRPFIAAEREACAKIARDTMAACDGFVAYKNGWIDACIKVAAAIRARK